MRTLGVVGMWFPSGMAVLDFTARITRFGSVDRAYPLVQAIAEIFDRLGLDHFLADLNRDGEAAWSCAYILDPITISGSCPLDCGLEGRIAEAAARLLPDADVRVEWFARDVDSASAMNAGRAIERVARMFGPLSRGTVPTRVRLAILSPDAYFVRYGDRAVLDPRKDPSELSYETFYYHVLYDALSDAGAAMGVAWCNDRPGTIAAFGDLMRAAEAHRDHDECHPVENRSRRCVVEDELEFVAETADYLNAAMFEAIRDVLAVTRRDVPVAAEAAVASSELWIA